MMGSTNLEEPNAALRVPLLDLPLDLRTAAAARPAGQGHCPGRADGLPVAVPSANSARSERQPRIAVLSPPGLGGAPLERQLALARHPPARGPARQAPARTP